MRSVVERVPLSERPEEQFRALAREYVEQLARFGVKAQVSRTPDLPVFRAASEKVRRDAVTYLEFNVVILREMIASGESPRETRKFLWRAIQRLKLTPPPDFMEYIRDDDGEIVELYFFDEFQVFRNLRFFEICSFTLEELLCRPWYNLVGRDWKSLLRLFRFVMKVKMGLIREPIRYDIPVHVAYEKNTPESNRFTMEFRYFIPVRSGGRVVGGISTNLSRVLA